MADHTLAGWTEGALRAARNDLLTTARRTVAAYQEGRARIVAAGVDPRVIAEYDAYIDELRAEIARASDEGAKE